VPPPAREGAGSARDGEEHIVAAMGKRERRRDGEERAHVMERSGVGWKEEKCVIHFFRWAMRGSRPSSSVGPGRRIRTGRSPVSNHYRFFYSFEGLTILV
jgi:hypothetical protein